MSLNDKCPICDADPGVKCYDPNGDLPFKGQHDARMSLSIERRVLERDIEQHQGEVNGINAQIGKLTARRRTLEEMILEKEAKL